MQALIEVFGPGGEFERGLPAYTRRAAQEAMAGFVMDAMLGGGHVAIEAGTGIGKTFAYLVPALISGRRIIVSTGTRTLQDQLFTRDLPLLGKVLGRPVTVALLKGRNNYVCRHRLEMASTDGQRDAESMATLEALRQFSQASNTGDLNEFDDLDRHPGLRAAVTSTVDNCLGNQCSFYDQCFVLEARRRAQRSRVVVVNHHLLLADLALKEAGFGELLPGADAVIVDEAHLFPDVAQQFFSVAISTRELEHLLRDLEAEARLVGAQDDIRDVSGPLVRSVMEAREWAIGQGVGRASWAAGAQRFEAWLATWHEALEELAGLLHTVADSGPGLSRCRTRCLECAWRIEQIMDARAESGLRWVERAARSLAFNWTPLEIGASLAERITAQGGAWIFASATLAVREDFAHFLTRLGLRDVVTHVLPSPFDYRRNARLYLPQGLPAPRDDEHTESLLHATWPLIEAIGGGAFLLFTSYRALRAAEVFIARQSAPGPVFVQGAGSRSQLLNDFRAAGNAILLGTGSFWQGVDVRGPALRLVLIDKLPFAAPSDPMVEARTDAVRRRGGDPFTEVQLPQAVLALKQGMGRLIRDFDDRGLVVLGDPRLRTRSYGRHFLASLPEIPVLEEFDEALAFACELAAPGAENAPAAVQSAALAG